MFRKARKRLMLVFRTLTTDKKNAILHTVERTLLCFRSVLLLGRQRSHRPAPGRSHTSARLTQG